MELCQVPKSRSRGDASWGNTVRLSGTRFIRMLVKRN
jgi:hypothetical protein